MELRDTARATDGCELAVTRFPAEGRAWATLVMAPAMAVRQDFYEPFARFLAQGGIHVLTFDYRGMGASRRGKIARVRADLTDWATRDLEAMLHEAQRMAPGLPLALATHSLGGQILGLAPSNASVRAMVNVVVGSGYYRFNERFRGMLRLLWYVLVPLLTPLCGYFPGRRLRIIGDLPRGVAWQWRRWCTNPRYALVEGEAAGAGFDRVTAAMLSYSFADDEMITWPAVQALHACYRNARVELRHVAPADAGLARIGHFGFFSERSRDTLWTEARQWLRGQLSPG